MPSDVVVAAAVVVVVVAVVGVAAAAAAVVAWPFVDFAFDAEPVALLEACAEHIGHVDSSSFDGHDDDVPLVLAPFDLEQNAATGNSDVVQYYWLALGPLVMSVVVYSTGEERKKYNFIHDIYASISN